MTIRKTVLLIHLWLGLASGIVVMILGITGCLLAFETEIRSITEPYKFVEAKHAVAFMAPSQLKQIAEKKLVSKKVLGIEYPGKGKAAIASYYDATNYEIVYLNPYTGQVLKHKNMTRDFFRFILEGHYYLWLPHTAGQLITASSTLIFLVMMITGLILWWPKNKAARKQRLSIKWSARWRRKNYDLHNVLGFYMTWIALFIVITGLVFGFQWFAGSVYWITSGGDQPVAHSDPRSDTTKFDSTVNMADALFSKHRATAGAQESVGVYFAAQKSDPVEVSVNHRPGTYYNTDYYHYDQYTGIALPATGSYAGKFSEAKVADKIVRMNYDIHVGAILSWPGKLLAFFASLIAASLPVTGFIIWWGKRNKKRVLKEHAAV